MVYQRDQVNKNFKPEPYFELNLGILTNQQKFVAKLDPYQRFKDEAGLMTFMQVKNYRKAKASYKNNQEKVINRGHLDSQVAELPPNGLCLYH